MPRPAKTTPDRRGGSKKGKRGNRKFVATAEQRIRVEAMVAAGAQLWFIAEELQVSEDTLTRHFPNEVRHGKDRILTKIGGSIIQKALNGNDDLAKFVMARIGGWKAATAVEATGRDGGPIEYRNLSDEEIEARIDALLAGHAASSAEG